MQRLIAEGNVGSTLVLASFLVPNLVNYQSKSEQKKIGGHKL